VTNLDSENRSPPADFTFLYDNMWTGESFFQDNRTIPGLLPGETTPLAFVVDVPTDMVGTAPLGTTRLDFVADFHSESMHDRNRKNNVVNMEIDADWWAPDYRLEEVSFVTAVTRRKQRVEFSVKNYGPVNATSGSLATVSSATGTHSASLFPVPPLDVLETSTTYGVELSQALCQVHVHTLTADGNNAITENDETNNEVVLGLGDDCSDRELRAAFEQPHLLEEQMYPWYLDQNLVQESEAVWAQVDEWLAAMQSELPTGPFLPGADTDDWGRRELYIPLAQGMALGVAPGSTQWNTDRLWYLDSALLSAPQQPVRTRWVQDLLQPQDQ
jgi:hypothetical protein